MLLICLIVSFIGKQKLNFKTIPVAMLIVFVAWLITVKMALPLLKWLVGV
jgi:hypothetical protein